MCHPANYTNDQEINSLLFKIAKLESYANGLIIHLHLPNIKITHTDVNHINQIRSQIKEIKILLELFKSNKDLVRDVAKNNLTGI